MRNPARAVRFTAEVKGRDRGIAAGEVPDRGGEERREYYVEYCGDVEKRENMGHHSPGPL